MILVGFVVCRGGEEKKELMIMMFFDIVEEFVNDMVVGIEDVTERAKEMRELLGKNLVEEEKDLGKEGKKDLSLEELIEAGVMPKEVEYVVDEEMRAHLKMNGGNDS